MQKAEVGQEQLLSHSYETDYALALLRYDQQGRRNATSFSGMIQSHNISPGMALKLGKSGLRLEHLQLAVSRSGREGLVDVLKEKAISGATRGTAQQKCIDAIL